MIAVIKTGGKQYKVEPGKKIKIEKIAGEAGKEITFKEVLLVEKSNKLEVGAPFVKGAEVQGKILSQGQAEKVIAFKYRSKTRRKTKNGFRQPFTEIEITKIEAGK